MKSPRTNLNFKIQMMSGNNVVLVQSAGFESELFMPQIVKDRISFQNIIPNRRCCDAASVFQIPNTYTQGLGTSHGSTPLRSPHQLLKMTREQHSSLVKPLARSTPSRTGSIRSKGGKENASPPLTPDQARCRRTELTVVKDIELPNLSVSYPLSPEPCVLNHGASFPVDTPPGTGPSDQLANIKSTDCIMSDLTRRIQPIRTYSRRKRSTANIAHPTASGSKLRSSHSWSPPQKKRKCGTKTPNPQMKLVVRNRKLIMDSKKSLGAHDPNQILESPITKKKIVKKQVTGKTRKQFEALKGTAYDLITVPSNPNMSTDLRAQFRLSCRDKRATTLPNYAEVAAMAPLQMDREVKSLLAKQKRLESSKQRNLPASMLKGKRI